MLDHSGFRGVPNGRTPPFYPDNADECDHSDRTTYMTEGPSEPQMALVRRTDP